MSTVGSQQDVIEPARALPAQQVPAWLWRCWLASLALSLQSGFVFGPLLAFGCLIFPPLLAIIVWQEFERAPVFGATVVATATLAAIALRIPMRRLCAGLGPTWRIIAVGSFAFWVGYAAGETIRWTMVTIATRNVAVDCHGAITLRESLDGVWKDWRPPHGWKVEHGVAWLWSYRSLRFEPAPEWVGAADLPAHCFLEPGRR